MNRTARPDRTVPQQLDLLQVLEDLRERVVDVEAVAHAAADREPPIAFEPDERLNVRRLMVLVERTHAGVESLISDIDAVITRAMRLGGEMSEVIAEGGADEDPTPIPE